MKRNSLRGFDWKINAEYGECSSMIRTEGKRYWHFFWVLWITSWADLENANGKFYFENLG